jgi:serine/threonine-protein kinase HipA
MTLKYGMTATDRTLIEISIKGQWVPAAELKILGPNRCRVEYLTSYIFSSDARLISLGLPLDDAPDKLMHGLEVDSKFDRRPPPFLYDLVPQGQGRRHLLRILNLADDDQMVMPLLAAGAFNPIGHLRIASALDFYKAQVALNEPSESIASASFTRTVGRAGRVSLEDIEKKSDQFLSDIGLHAMLASGTTGVQGVAPKYLLTQDLEGFWHPDMALPDHLAKTHWLVKLPRGRADVDRSILRHEAAYLKIASACGLRSAKARFSSSDMLFVERFDRLCVSAKVHRLHQESLASLAGLRGFAPATSQNDLLAALRRHCTDPLSEAIEFMKRDVLNLALRNTDNHARNTAIQVTDEGVVQLTPFYDFCPMFMDPEIIPRSLHWRSASGLRLDRWDQIIEEIDCSNDERARISNALFHFSQTISNLFAIAQDCGVEGAVLSQCAKSIEAQQAQLSGLAHEQTQDLSGQAAEQIGRERPRG